MAASPVSTRALFKNILFATDFSSASDTALSYVLGVARSHDSKVIVTHAVPQQPLDGFTPSAPLVEIDREWRDAQQKLQEYRDTDTFIGLRHEFVLEHGDPIRVIKDLVAHEGVDLVVLGTHGRTGFRKLFSGSLTEEIFREVTCPILVIGPNSATQTARLWQPQRILFATEFCPGSRHALPYAIALTEEHHATLTLLHVVPLVPWEQQTELTELYQQRLREIVASSATSLKMEFSIRFDLATPGILAAARDQHADLIVMGARRTPFGEFESHVPGSTAYEVICNAHCPVLTVRG
jgi:nucleotide-binding universal stress UspA family protein